MPLCETSPVCGQNKKRRFRSVCSQIRSAEIAERRFQAIQAFDQTISVLAELKSLPGCGACRPDPVVGFRNGLTFPKIEFIADCEIAAKAALNVDDFHAFWQLVCLETLASDKIEAAQGAAKLGISGAERYRLAERVGRFFIARGLWPTGKYFARTKCSTAGWPKVKLK